MIGVRKKEIRKYPMNPRGNLLPVSPTSKQVNR